MGTSVDGSVGVSVGASVDGSVGTSVDGSVRVSVGGTVGGSGHSGIVPHYVSPNLMYVITGCSSF